MSSSSLEGKAFLRSHKTVNSKVSTSGKFAALNPDSPMYHFILKCLSPGKPAALTYYEHLGVQLLCWWQLEIMCSIKVLLGYDLLKVLSFMLIIMLCWLLTCDHRENMTYVKKWAYLLGRCAFSTGRSFASSWRQLCYFPSPQNVMTLFLMPHYISWNKANEVVSNHCNLCSDCVYCHCFIWFIESP